MFYSEITAGYKPVQIFEGTGVGLKNLSNKYAILAGRDISVSDDGNVFSVKLPLL